MREACDDVPMRRVNISDPSFTYDPADPEGFRRACFASARRWKRRRPGRALYELPPGQALCPYHYEYGEEEWALVIEGRPSMRTPEGTEQLEPFDVVFFPKGPAGAHAIRNDTDGAVRVLMWSNVVYPTATAYPDSDKVGVWTGDKAEDVMVPRSSKVDYYHGETD